jgi:hypothetical protein
MPAIGVVFQMLLGGLIAIAPTLIGRILLSLGIGVVSYTGISVTLSYLQGQVVEKLSALPVEVINALALMKVGASISVIMSAISVRLVLNGLQGDTIKRWVTR